MTMLRGRYDGKVIIPEAPVDIPAGSEVEFQVWPVSDGRRGSPEELLRIIQSLPPIPPEWMEELERAIESGHQPASFEGAFDEPMEDKR